MKMQMPMSYPTDPGLTPPKTNFYTMVAFNLFLTMLLFESTLARLLSAGSDNNLTHAEIEAGKRYIETLAKKDKKRGNANRKQISRYIFYPGRSHYHARETRRFVSLKR